MRQVDEIHDAEDQCQARRQQEQQHPELDAVEKLLEEIEHGLTAALCHLSMSAHFARACRLRSSDRAARALASLHTLLCQIAAMESRPLR